MGKKKLLRFRELKSFEKVFQPPVEEVLHRDFHLKGRWKEEIFGNRNPIVLELGCGKGEYTVGLARNNPHINYMGMDIKGARIWTGAKSTREEGLENVAFLRTRIDFVTSFFGPDEIDEIWIPFPDPQENSRRQKKRLTNALFLNRYQRFLKDQGKVNLKTDNQNLYSYTLELVKYNNLPLERSTENLYNSGWEDESVTIQTYYESHFLSMGARIYFLTFGIPGKINIKELPNAKQ